MSVPRQVSETADLAEQLHSQMFSPEVIDDEEVDTETSPNEEAGPTEDVDTTPKEDADDIEAKYEARYKTLQGKYNVEVPRLIEELRELKQSVFERLEKATKPAEQAPVVDETSEFIDSFAENYGEDFAENLRKLIALEASKLNQPIQKQVENVEETQVKAAQTNFVSYIDENLRDAVPDWQDKWSGKDPKFVEFLAKPDPSGLYTYAQLAEIANQNWDADKLVNIFKLYTEESTPVVPKTKPKTSPQQEAIVAPSRTNTHVAPDTNGKKVWTNDMVAEFQRLDRQGKYSAEDSKVLWDDLLSALAENRIR